MVPELTKRQTLTLVAPTPGPILDQPRILLVSHFRLEPLNIHDVKSRPAFSSQEYFAIVGTNAARSVSFASLTFVSGHSLSV